LVCHHFAIYLPFPYHPTDDEGWESPGELLYPDSDPETASDSTSQSRSSTPTVHPAQGPPVRQVSHARRRSADHVPRPPNSFILFRSDYCVRNKQLDSEAVRDHALVSQLAGKAWRALSPAARKEYEDIAQEKKKEHAEKYPGYTYSPTSRSGGKGKKRKAADDGDYEERARQSKQRTRAQPLRVVVESQGSFSSANSTRKGSCVAPTVRTSASSPELARSQTPELSPNSSSSSESPDPDPVICTPAITHPQDDDFVPTSEIPPLNLYAPTSEEVRSFTFARCSLS
jgi:hypothetical protein